MFFHYTWFLGISPQYAQCTDLSVVKSFILYVSNKSCFYKEFTLYAGIRNLGLIELDQLWDGYSVRFHSYDVCFIIIFLYLLNVLTSIKHVWITDFWLVRYIRHQKSEGWDSRVFSGPFLALLHIDHILVRLCARTLVTTAVYSWLDAFWYYSHCSHYSHSFPKPGRSILKYCKLIPR